MSGEGGGGSGEENGVESGEWYDTCELDSPQAHFLSYNFCASPEGNFLAILWPEYFGNCEKYDF